MAARIRKTAGVTPRLIASGGGAFEIRVNGELIYSKLETGEWPEAEDWWALSDSGKTLDIITFSNYWQLIRTAERQALMWASFSDAQLQDAA